MQLDVLIKLKLEQLNYEDNKTFGHKRQVEPVPVTGSFACSYYQFWIHTD